MEIEPYILDELILDLIYDACELRPNPELRPLLIDQVNEYLFTVLAFDFIDMLLGEGHRFLMILIDHNTWTPFHGRFLTPEGWD